MWFVNAIALGVLIYRRILSVNPSKNCRWNDHLEIWKRLLIDPTGQHKKPAIAIQKHREKTNWFCANTQIMKKCSTFTRSIFFRWHGFCCASRFLHAVDKLQSSINYLIQLLSSNSWQQWSVNGFRKEEWRHTYKTYEKQKKIASPTAFFRSFFACLI